MLISTLFGRLKRGAKPNLSFAPHVDELEWRLAPAAPLVLSIDRMASAPPNTSAASVKYTVTFDQSVTGVDAADFKVTTTGALAVTTPVVVAAESGASYSVTVSGIRGSGDLRLDLIDNDSIVGGGLALGGAGVSNGSFQGQTYTILQTFPSAVSIIRTTPAAALTNSSSALFTVTFSEAVTGVDPTDFTVVKTGTISAPLLQITPVSTSVYTATISGITGSGTLGLNLADDGSIHDLRGNPLAANVATSFRTPVAFATGSAPHYVTLGDVNGDGKPDLAVANYGSDAPGVLLGNGDGTFQAQQTFAASNGPFSAILGDVNGDGKPDLAVANIYSNTISVLLGNGDGAFQAQQTFATGYCPTVLALGDVNGDGKPDLATANYISNSVSVLLGHGDGTFAAQQPFDAGIGAYWLALGDVNSDGKPDVAVANYFDNTASVLLGNGDGTFQARRNFVTGDHPVVLTMGDLNGDGKLDLAVPNRNSNTVSVLLGNGNGTFQVQRTFATGNSPFALTIGDLNGDGKLDLAVPNQNSSTMSVLLGNGDGTFQAQRTLATGNTPFVLTMGDLNGDGKPDLVSANNASSSVSVSIGNSNLTGQTYTIDRSAPSANIEAVAPDPRFTSVGAVAIYFNEPVQNLDITDFTLTRDGHSVPLNASMLTGSGSQYSIDLSAVTQSAGAPELGNYALTLNTSDIQDLAGNPLASGAAEDWRIIAATNLHLSSAQLVDANNQPMIAPFKGEQVFVRAQWTSQSLAANASYRVSYSVDGIVLATNPLTLGAGDAFSESWEWNLGGWFASPGSHTVVVTLDSERAVAETNEADNVTSFTFSPVTATGLPAQKLVTPMGGTPFQAWGIRAYVDVNPLAGNSLDYKNADRSYDGHNGWDMGPANFAAMDAGLVEYAAAAGTVDAVRDGNFDRNITRADRPANFIFIDIGNGWRLAYGHLRANTILVRPGDKVVAGQVLGLVGSSGDATGVHLHFAVVHNGNFVETSYDPGTYWASPLAYQGDVRGILDMGITAGDTSLTAADLGIQERPVTANVLTTSGGQVTVWFSAFSRSGDARRIKFYRPDNFVFSNTLLPAAGAGESRGGPSYQQFTLPEGLAPGTWQVAVEFNGVELARKPLLVDNKGAGAARVTTGATFIPNGRTTPVDFGTVSPSAATPIRNLTITNLGTAPLNLSNLVLPSGFTLNGGFPSSIAVNSSATIAVAMTTSTSGMRFGALSFATSDPSAPIYSFNIKGLVRGGNTGALHGQLFNDQNGDGIENGAELGMKGWNVTLVSPADDRVLATTTTSFNGYYAFLNLAPGNYRVRQTPPPGWQQSTANPADVAVTTSDVLVSPIGLKTIVPTVTVNGNIASLTGQERSRVVSLVVTFDKPVQFDVGAMSLALHTNNVTFAGAAQPAGIGAVPTALDFTTTDQMTWVVTFRGNTDDGADGLNSLQDGVYDFNIDGSLVHPLGQPTVNLAASSTTTFHRLFGDTDGSNATSDDFQSVVNTGDNLAFRAAFNQPAGGGYQAFLDFNGDGVINTADNLQFRSRFNKTLTWRQ